MIPMMTADIAVINTAAAPTSLPTLASGWRLGLAKSTTASRAVLRNSAVQTKAMVRISKAHSGLERPNQAANASVQAVARAWIQAFFWVRMTYHQPAKAARKERTREPMKSIIAKANCKTLPEGYLTGAALLPGRSTSLLFQHPRRGRGPTGAARRAPPAALFLH
jgi:hypothetical protein